MALVAASGCVDRVPDFGLDVEPPEVIATDPAANAAGADRGTAIRVTFSEPVDEATVTSSSFRVLRNGVALAGSIATTSSSATFTPGAPLDDVTTYFIEVSTDVEDL